MDENASYPYFEDVNLGLLRLWGTRTGRRVLDVGCGFATTTRVLQDLGNDVTGVEESEAACAVARSRIARVVQADVRTVDLGAAEYDVIVLADVLEHLPWPVGVLRRYLRWLAPSGTVIVSLPNVGLWSARLSHLVGRWEYEDTGVLDRTHLRFFTRRSARWLLREAGLRTCAATYNPGLLRPFVPLFKRALGGGQGATERAPDALLSSRSYRFYVKAVHPLERAVASVWPGLLAFQMIFEATRERP